MAGAWISLPCRERAHWEPSVSSQQCASLPPCASDFQGEMLSELLRAGWGWGGRQKHTSHPASTRLASGAATVNSMSPARSPDTGARDFSWPRGRALGLWSMRSQCPGWGPRRSPESCEGEGEAGCWSCSRAPAYPGSPETSSWVGCEMQRRVPPTPMARDPTAGASSVPMDAGETRVGTPVAEKTQPLQRD